MSKKHYNIGKNNSMYGTHRCGKDNPNYRNGHTLIKQKCKNCGKQTSEYRRKLCRDCYFIIYKNRKNMINKHHLDLNQKNNNKDNLLYLIGSLHQSLHKLAYHYLLEKFGIKEVKKYTKWFAKKKGIKL